MKDVIDGFLNVDKPADMTSMDVVRRIKRASRQKRVGHGGTLDPMATGVVPISLGRATRMMEFLIDGTKEYRGSVHLGVETDTYDSVGEVVDSSDTSSLGLQDIEQALEAFKGPIDQVPPMYSALKIQGKRLYHLARAGIEVERKPRRVKVSRIELLGWSPPVVSLHVTCGRGFYMRSLAHDLGQELGCGGHLNSLVRLRTGPFEISESLSLPNAERSFEDDGWRHAVYAPDVVVGQMRAAIVDKRVEEMIKRGQRLPEGIRLPVSTPDERCRVYSADGGFLAVLRFNGPAGRWQPERVLV